MADIRLVKSNIVLLEVDAIVNAANNSLLGGSGVDGAIHRAAGPELLAACRDIRNTKYQAGLPTGEAVATPGFNLLARYVIHTVGPVWQGGAKGEPEILAACYRNALRIAMALEDNVRRIAFPAISTGVYGYPKDLAEKVERHAIESFLEEHPDYFGEILLVRYP